jgi:hypothetical protein
MTASVCATEASNSGTCVGSVPSHRMSLSMVSTITICGPATVARAARA